MLLFAGNDTATGGVGAKITGVAEAQSTKEGTGGTCDDTDCEVGVSSIVCFGEEVGGFGGFGGFEEFEKNCFFTLLDSQGDSVNVVSFLTLLSLDF